MQRLIKDRAIVDNRWDAVQPDGDALELARREGQILTEEQWLQALAQGVTGRAVQLEPGQSPEPLLDRVAELELVAINFPVFMDGRGFSHGRELRERGFRGELRAVGNFIRDQLFYLSRCGFNAFELQDESSLQDALQHFGEISEAYQAAIDRDQPLFRRRTG